MKKEMRFVEESRVRQDQSEKSPVESHDSIFLESEMG